MDLRHTVVRLYEKGLRLWKGSQAVLSLPSPPALQRIAYGDDPWQFGDLHLPEGPGPHPMVILIHGGFWRAAYSLEHAGHLAAALARAGYACWSLEYRRIGNPGGGWPGTFQDVTLGAAHLSNLAGVYALDLERAAAVGHSAGGHLALWLASAARLPQGSELTVSGMVALRGVVSLAGVCDLRRAYELKLSRGAVEEFMQGPPHERPERYQLASPIEQLPLGLPQVLLHGMDDPIVPLEISERYAIAARANGDPAELLALNGIGHFEWIDPASRAWPVLLENLRRMLA